MFRRTKYLPIPKPDKEEPLPVKTGFRVNQHLMTHGTGPIMRAYYADALDKRKSPGRFCCEQKNRYARQKGYNSFKDCPETLKKYITLMVGCELFLAVYEPAPGCTAGLQLVKATENNFARLLINLGLKPAEKVINLRDYIEAK